MLHNTQLNAPSETETSICSHPPRCQPTRLGGQSGLREPACVPGRSADGVGQLPSQAWTMSGFSSTHLAAASSEDIPSSEMYLATRF